MAGHVGDGKDAARAYDQAARLMRDPAARTNFPQSSGGNGTLSPTLHAELDKCTTAPPAQDPQHGADVPITAGAGSSSHGAFWEWDDDEDDDAAALKVVDGDKGEEYFNDIVDELFDPEGFVLVARNRPAPAEQDKPGQEYQPPPIAQMAALTQQVEGRKKRVPLPQWLKDYKSTFADVDLDGWTIVAVDRMDQSGRNDKYYTHRDYRCTFRSKVAVKHFLDTGEFQGKVLQQKKSAIDPSGQSSGHKRSTRRRILQQPTNDPPNEPIGFKRRLAGGMFRNLREAPPGFL